MKCESELEERKLIIKKTKESLLYIPKLQGGGGGGGGYFICMCQLRNNVLIISYVYILLDRHPVLSLSPVWSG